MIGSVRWPLFLAACLLGAGAFAALFPRFDAAATEWRTRAGRPQIIAAAARLASLYGIDTEGWSFLVTAEYLRDRRLARLERPSSEVLAAFPPLQFIVHASKPGSGFRIQVTLAENLRPLGFRTYGPRWQLSGQPPHDMSKKQGERKGRGMSFRPADPQAAAAEAAAQLHIYAGSAAAHYVKTAFSIPTPEGMRSAWEWADPAEPGIAARLELFTRRGSVHRVEHSLRVAESLIQRRRSDAELPRDFVALAGAFFVTLTLFPAFWFFFKSLAQTFVPLRFATALLPWFALPMALDMLLGPAADGAVISAAAANTSTSTAWTNNGLALLMISGAFLVLIGAGRYLLAPEEQRAWSALQCIYLKLHAARPAGSALLAGLAAGPALAALPLLAVLLSGSSGAAVQSIPSPVFLCAAHPWIAALGEANPALPLAVFGFVLPWMRRVLRATPAVVFTVAFYGLIAIFLFDSPLSGRSPLAIGACVLKLGGLWLVYSASGLLGVWASALSSAAAAASYAYALNGLSAQALSAAAPLAFLAAAGGLMAAFGLRPSSLEIIRSFEIQPREVIVNERARLDAEFAVASEAQQRLLPRSAPPLPGFSIAGSCSPAREVGGDLFDYFPVPGGPVALCVADVSGKGVQAALYMTLTKGMLASAHGRRLSLLDLASSLNRHLLAAGRRKTFVTMSLAWLDPATRRFLHVRAGHNPPLLYRARTDSWSLLKPRGIGLGLAPPARFDPLLELEEILLEPGDAVVLYSDGLTEMMNSRGELYGESRLGETVRAHAGAAAQAIHDAILRSVRAFQGDAEQHDDLTLLVVKAELPLT